MSNWTIGRKIASGFLLILLQALSVGIFGLWWTNHTASKLNAVSAEYLPETQMATQIEREILNARIHFIYFVTIQKEGALDKGRERFHNAQQQLPKLQALVNSSDSFKGIRPDIDQLSRDFDSYQPVLEHIIGVVASGRNALAWSAHTKVGGGCCELVVSVLRVPSTCTFCVFSMAGLKVGCVGGVCKL